jgi:hypothetical protein
MRRSVVGTLVTLMSCTMSTVVPEAQTAEFKPQGEVMMRNRGASFDEVRIRSPRCNLSKRTDGSWGGILNERPFDVSVTDVRISGANFSLTREASEGRHTVITGQFEGKIYRFEFDETHAFIRAPNVSLNFDGMVVEGDSVRYGPMGNFVLRGTAAAPSPPWPQVAFALMGALQ